MPYAIRYTPGAPLAVIAYSGRITGHDVVESVEALAARLPESPGRLSVLCDTREATSIMVFPGDLERGVRAFRQFETRATQGRGAYVGGRNHPLFIGLVRIFLTKLGRTGRERGVFTDVDEALQWLGEVAA